MWTLERGVSLVSQDLNPGLPDSVTQDPPIPFGWGQAEVSRVALGIAMGTGPVFGGGTAPAGVCCQFTPNRLCQCLRLNGHTVLRPWISGGWGWGYLWGPWSLGFPEGVSC